MALERRILTGYKEAEDSPGLVIDEQDKLVQVVTGGDRYVISAPSGQPGTMGLAVALIPFEVTFESLDIETDEGTLLMVMPAGSVYISARCFVSEPFDDDGDVSLSVYAAVGEASWLVDSWLVGQQADDADGIGGAVIGQDPETATNGAYFSEEGFLFAKLSAAAEVGAATVHALVYVP